MSLLGMIFGDNRTIDKPTFIKDFSKDNIQLKDLEELSLKLKDWDKKELIEKDIMFSKQGISGESNVYYELKNSFMPMLCLYDVRLEHEDYVAQLDFVIITNKFLAILETKKLSGDITINQDGDFIRTIRTKYGKQYKEGIYSPISQNKRHLNIIKDLLAKKLDINNMPIISLVVIANPKSIVNKDKCPKDIKYSIYKYDQVITQLEKYKNDKKNEYNLDEKNMYRIANLLVESNAPIAFNNIAKYNLLEDDFIKTEVVVKETLLEKPKMIEDVEKITEPIKVPKTFGVENNSKKSKESLIEDLKEYRLERSRLENIPAYCIFNNAEMEALIESYPCTIEQLANIKGFGTKKIEKFGEDILKIFNC